MTSLVKLLDGGHGEAIEADLMRHYQCRLRDLFDPASDLSPREVLTYLRNIPEDSAWITAVRGGPQFRGWNADRYFLANLQDLLAGANYQRSGGKGRKPKPVARPKKKDQRAGTPIAATIPKSIRRQPTGGGRHV